MKVLIAEDDLIPRRMLEATLAVWGYEVQAVVDGPSALDALLAPDAPKLAILDWMMPGMDGVEVCRRVRARPTDQPPFLILLTGRTGKEDVVAALQAGANDHVAKPFDRAELQARLQVGRQVVELQAAVSNRVRELEEALAQVRQLQGLLPICMYCKKVRDDEDYWEQVEHYLSRHSGVRFSHGICPACWESQVKPQLPARPGGQGGVYPPGA